MICNSEKLDNRWLAVQVRSGWELRTAYALKERGYEEFVPLRQQKRRWSDRTKVVSIPLFSGYVFLRFSLRNQQPIVTAPGIIRLVGMGDRVIPIDDDEIQALRSVSEGALAYGTCAFMAVGQDVIVRNGPLAGVRGKISRFKNKQRLIISVSLLQKSVFVEMDGYDVIPVSSSYSNGRGVARPEWEKENNYMFHLSQGGVEAPVSEGSFLTSK